MKLTSKELLAYLTTRNIFLAIGAFIAYKVVAQIVYYRFFSPLRKFPGPFWGTVTRLWIGWKCWRQTELNAITNLHEQYGPVLRITPTLLLVSDSMKIPDIYHGRADKSDHYVTGSCGEVEALFNMKKHHVHARLRRIAAGPYSFSNIKKMEPMIDNRMKEWADMIAERYAETGKPFDLCDQSVFMAYDIVSEIGFGKPFGFIPAGHDIDGLIQGFHDGMTPFGLLARFHPFTTWLKTTPLGRLIIASPEDKYGIGVLMRYRDKLYDQRVKDIEEGKAGSRVDILQAFMQAKMEDGKPLDPDYIKAEILLVILAGADTTGTTFQAMFYYIMGTPGVYDRMMKEIDAATRSGYLSDPIPQYDEVIKHCPYYMACVRESMRLCPAAPNIFPRIVPASGLDLFGKFAPPGTEVTCNPYFVHRDKSFYGEDANDFKPERWLESEARTRELLKYNFAFGYGPRICLGKDIAIIELAKGPLHFFRKFDAQLVDNSKPGDWIVHGGVSFWENMMVIVKLRDVVKHK